MAHKILLINIVRSRFALSLICRTYMRKTVKDIRQRSVESCEKIKGNFLNLKFIFNDFLCCSMKMSKMDKMTVIHVDFIIDNSANNR
jgi:hypothetical protein